MSIATQHGEWRVRAFADGRIEVESFIPNTGKPTDAVARVMQRRKTASEAFQEQQQKRMEWRWADANKSNEDPEIRKRARDILGMGAEPTGPMKPPPPLPAEVVESMTDAQLAELPEEQMLSVEPEKRHGLLARAASWIKAEASLVTDGALDDEAFKARMAQCKSCEHLERRDDPRIGFCKACGCGRNPRAELTVKGRMPAATCPKGKWPALPAK